jgi:hypothetical protein
MHGFAQFIERTLRDPWISNFQQALNDQPLDGLGA